MKRVGILRGGKGENYHKSIRQGGDLIVCITENLKDKYKPIDILIDTEGEWHLAGLPILPAQIVHKVDIVWNTAAPEYAIILSNFSIPVVSENSFTHSISESRAMLEEHLQSAGAKMPRHMVLPVYQEDFDGDREKYAIKKAKEVHAKFPAPWIVKTLNPDSGTAIQVAKTFGSLAQSIENNLNSGQSIVIDEFITGTPGAVHTVSNFRGEEVYAIPEKKFNKDEKEKITLFAKNLHKHLGVETYLKSDFTLHPRLGVYVTSISLTPDLRASSHLEESLHSVGAKLEHLIEHILEHP
jgi:D-alanine-D-alanine ligase-like ATP-grasp enzyme